MEWVDPSTPEAMAARIAAATPEAEVVASAPGRVNLIGEHTDYNAGLCLPVALPHATWAGVRRIAGPACTVRSAQSDEAWTGTVDEAAHAEGWAAYAAGVLWALRETGLELPAVEVSVDSTVPVGAGLSSSAALECAVATAVCGLLGLELSPSRREEIAEACVRAESEVAGAPTGGMDQAVAMLAHAEHALLLDFDSGVHRQVPLDLAADDLALLVIDTRVSHALTDGGYGSRRADCEQAVRELGVSSLREATEDQLASLGEDRVRARARHVVSEIERVAQTVQALESRDWVTVGSLMNASHVSMRDDFEISCPELDLAVATAQARGALGARMTGGGFGGSAVALVRRGELDGVAAAVTAAAESSAYPTPGLLLATPSCGAGLRSLQG